MQRVIVGLGVLNRMSIEAQENLEWMTEFGPVEVIRIGYSGMGEMFLVTKYGTHYVEPGDIFRVDARFL